MWMTDREIYLSYQRADNQHIQLKILSELNACPTSEVEEAIKRYEKQLDKEKEYYKELAKAREAQEKQREQSKKPYAIPDQGEKKITKVTISSFKEIDKVINSNPEPILGIQPKRRDLKLKRGRKKKFEVEKQSITNPIQNKEPVQVSSTIPQEKKFGRGPDTKIRWRKRTVIKEDYEIDWNNWIDSMREHLEMAKECEKQLMRLEKTYGSHRRKERKK